VRIRVTANTVASVEAVWPALANIASHVDWMLDAEAITFVGEQRQGVGTTFDCRTRVGPFVLVDRMVVTDWRDGCAIGVDHKGVVAGHGRFELKSRAGGGAVIAWTETLAFPARLGGPVTIWFAWPVLTAIWKGNLRRLAALCDTQYR